MRYAFLRGVQAEGHPNTLNVSGIPHIGKGDRVLNAVFKNRAKPSLGITDEVTQDMEHPGPLVMVSGDQKTTRIVAELVYSYQLLDIEGAHKNGIVTTTDGIREVKEHSRILTPRASKVLTNAIPCDNARIVIEQQLYDHGSAHDNGHLMHLHAFITDEGETVVDFAREVKLDHKIWSTQRARYAFDTDGEPMEEAELIQLLSDRQTARTPEANTSAPEQHID